MRFVSSSGRAGVVASAAGYFGCVSPDRLGHGSALRLLAVDVADEAVSCQERRVDRHPARIGPCAVSPRGSKFMHLSKSKWRALR